MHIDDSSLFLRTRFIPREIEICLLAIDMRMEADEKNNASSIDCILLIGFLTNLFFFFFHFYVIKRGNMPRERDSKTWSFSAP